jgi:hypothetical protein
MVHRIRLHFNLLLEQYFHNVAPSVSVLGSNLRHNISGKAQQQVLGQNQRISDHSLGLFLHVACLHIKTRHFK